jgi:regulator of sigma E protease
VDLLYFTLLISTLIFVHELGHFVFAKIFGVKVLTFSIGFGPKVVRLRGKETEYCIALFPLGGFVKMLEEAKDGPAVLPEDKPRTFEAQALWKRIAIVLAGPTMNVLFPLLLYTSVFLEDNRAAPPPTVGVVIPGKPADGKLVLGDRIVSVDDQPVSSFPEVQRLVSERAGKPTRFEISRDGRIVSVTITPADETLVEEPRELGLVEHVGQIGFHPAFVAPVIGVPRTDSPAYRAGLRTFDRIVSINGRKVDRYVDLVNMLAANKGDAVVVALERPIDVPGALGGLCDVAVLDPEVATLTLSPRGAGQGLGSMDEDARARDVLVRAGIESADLYAAFVPEGSSEWRAGLRAGDRITLLDGRTQRLWQTLEDDLVLGANKRRTLAWTRGGEPMQGAFQLRKEEWDDEYGQHYERYVFRTTHESPYSLLETVPDPSPLLHAVRRSFEETLRAVRLTTLTFERLLQGRLRLSSVSGPITIYDMAGRAGAKGGLSFAWAMAFISINIGLVNLLPIPVLDGGHLFFMMVEAVQRRPLPLRVREVASLVGMTVLILLMAIAFKNDVSRRWDVIRGQVHEIFG